MSGKSHSVLALLGLLALSLAAGACNTPVDEAPEDLVGSSSEGTEEVEAALGNASCAQIMSCYARCLTEQQGSQACIEACYNGGSEKTQQAVNAFNTCLDAKGCTDVNCAACTTERNVCYPPAPATPVMKWHCYADGWLSTHECNTRNDCQRKDLEPVFGLGVSSSKFIAFQMADNMCWNNFHNKRTVTGRPAYQLCETFSCVYKAVR